jgi:hypothetical protein
VKVIITILPADRVRELTADVGLHTGKGLRIPPPSVKSYTVSGRGCGADDAPARLRQTPQGPEGRAVRPGRHTRPGPFRALDQSPVDIRNLSEQSGNGFDRAK